jgi:hypothetical protein
VFKQFLQARATDVIQIDACRVAGVNKILANLQLPAKLRYRSARTQAARDCARSFSACRRLGGH